MSLDCAAKILYLCSDDLYNDSNSTFDAHVFKRF